jgi:hypothetical protein
MINCLTRFHGDPGISVMCHHLRLLVLTVVCFDCSPKKLIETWLELAGKPSNNISAIIALLSKSKLRQDYPCNVGATL